MTAHGPEMEQALRELGLKLTSQRRAIVRAFADDPTHPTAQEVYDRLRTTFPGMSVATVYNTLAVLQAAGLCRQITLAGGPVRFDPATHHHHHAVCDRCGCVRDVADAAPGDTAREGLPAEVPSELPLQGFAVRAVERVYRGLCARCQAVTAQPETTVSP